LDALYRARKSGPFAIIARTEKGRGVSFLEGAHGWHGKALSREEMDRALKELGETGVHMTVEPRRVGEIRSAQPEPPPPQEPGYRRGEKVATRKGFGNALKKLGEYMPELVVIDGDVSNSTYTELFA